MNLRITNFTLMALLSSAAFGMDIQTPDDAPKVRMLINGQVRDVIIATTAQMGPMALIRNQYQRPADNDDAPENTEFKKLLSANTERMGVVPHLYARSLLQLDYHDEMIELLTSELSALEKLKIYEGKGNSNYAIEIVSKDMDTLKEKNPLNKRKNFKCVFNNLFQQNIKEKGRVINQSNLQHIYQTLTSSQIERKAIYSH